VDINFLKFGTNGRPAPAGEGLLGREFVFVFCSYTSFVVHFESLGLPGTGAGLLTTEKNLTLRSLIIN